jgi:hypothetical protein
MYRDDRSLQGGQPAYHLGEATRLDRPAGLVSGAVSPVEQIDETIASASDFASRTNEQFDQALHGSSPRIPAAALLPKDYACQPLESVT